MDALIFIINTLLGLVLVVMELRLLLQWVRADFRNPICQAVVRVTNPLVLPLRRVLPPIGKLDTASIVAVLIVAIVHIAIVLALQGGTPATPIAWVRLVVLQIVTTALWIYFYAIVLYALLGLIAAGTYSPVHSVLTALCEPILRPIRRVIPPIAGIDLSPLWVVIAIQALLILLR